MENSANNLSEKFKRLSFNKKDYKRLHLRTISNYIYHLEKNPISGTRKSNIKKIGYLTTKENVATYIDLIQDDRDVSKESSEEYFRKFVYPMSLYMSSNYGFVYLDLGAVIVKLILLTIVVLGFDILIGLLIGIKLYLIFASLIIFFLRYFVKINQRRFFICGL